MCFSGIYAFSGASGSGQPSAPPPTRWPDGHPISIVVQTRKTRRTNNDTTTNLCNAVRTIVCFCISVFSGYSGFGQTSAPPPPAGADGHPLLHSCAEPEQPEKTGNTRLVDRPDNTHCFCSARDKTLRGQTSTTVRLCSSEPPNTPAPLLDFAPSEATQGGPRRAFLYIQLLRTSSSCRAET